MKKNDYLLLIATGAYSFLFFHQNAGINFLLFNIIFLVIIVVKNVKLSSSKKWLWSALMCLISAACIFIHSSALSIIANVVSLLVLSAVSFNIVTSRLFSFLFSFYSVAFSVAHIIIDSVTRIQATQQDQVSKKGYKAMATGLVLLLSIFFFNMYKDANPLFADNTKWINFDFISMSWIGFTLGGFLLVYGLLNHKVINAVEIWESNLPLLNIQATEDELRHKRYETERYAGLLLFALLNIMLVVLNIGDIQTLYFDGGLPKNITHSDFVHSGVGVIIFSIIIATSLIMYLFRAEFKDVKNNQLLVVSVYLWILQNVIMLSSTTFRNQIYIHQFNFTDKRIGVYVWLALAAFGLCIMFWKIYKKRSNWYLIRSNVALWFSVLVLSACVNWDKLITSYNIQNKPLTQVDFNYLFSLSDANIPELMEVTKRNDFKSIDGLNKFYSDRYDSYAASSYRYLLRKKIDHYLSDYTNDWRSFDMRDKEITTVLYTK
ncbi:MAG: DUF4153 domain-containing protein [Bacteroidota bacterium]